MCGGLFWYMISVKRQLTIAGERTTINYHSTAIGN